MSTCNMSAAARFRSWSKRQSETHSSGSFGLILAESAQFLFCFSHCGSSMPFHGQWILPLFFFQFSLNILKFLVHCDGPKYSKGLPAKPVLPHRLLLSVAAQCVPDEVWLMKESNFTISGVCFCNLGGAGLFLQSLRNYFQESNVLSDVISVCVCVFVAYTNLLIKHIVELSHSCGNRKQVNTKHSFTIVFS